MATTQEKTTPCCVTNATAATKSLPSKTPPALPQKPSDDRATAAPDPSEDPSRKRSTVATVIHSFDTITDSPPTNAASNKGLKPKANASSYVLFASFFFCFAPISWSCLERWFSSNYVWLLRIME